MFARLLLVLSFVAILGCGPAADNEVNSVSWTSMGTTATLRTRHDGEAESEKTLFKIQDVFQRVEHELSRYDTNSVLRKTGRPTPFSQPCWDAADRLKEMSKGVFNVNWRGGTDLDFGGIAKGFAVDLAADAAREIGGDYDLLVDLGGNLKAVRGAWRTGVRDPNGERVAAFVDLRPGESLATSAEYYRGKHIKDGRTGRAVSNEVASVTVLSTSATWADGLSTTLFILGPDAGRPFLRDHAARFPSGLAVLWLLRDGRRVALDPSSRFR